MKSIYIHISYIIVLLAFVCSGCQEDRTTLPQVKSRVEVKMNALVQPATKAVVEPNEDRYPTKRLTIGIITSDYYLPHPLTEFKRDMLTKEDWGMYTYLDRGYFGVDGGGDAAIHYAGEVKYLNEDGTAIQNVFYDEMGMYYTLRLVYPFVYKSRDANYEKVDTKAELLLSPDGSQILFDIDGSQDIMSSDIGWGNMDSPDGKVTTKEKGEAEYSITPSPADSLAVEKARAFNFNHHLVKLDVQLKAEAGASVLYGTIDTIELINQPSQVMLDITTDTLVTATEPDSRYILVSADAPADDPDASRAKGTFSLSANSTDLLPYGYVMALPASKYTFRISTQNRLKFYVDVIIQDPERAKAGYYYTVTFNFLATEDVRVGVSTPKEWWYDSTFN